MEIRRRILVKISASRSKISLAEAVAFQARKITVIDRCMHWVKGTR